MDGYKVIDKQEIGNYNWDKILAAADRAYGSIREDIRKMGIDEGKVESLTRAHCLPEKIQICGMYW